MANTGNPKLIALQCRKILYAVVGTSMPSLARPMVWSGSGWTECGYFDGDVPLDLTEERIKYKPHGAAGPLITRTMTKGISFTVNLGETDLRKIKMALSTSVESGTTLKDGGVATDVAYLAWALETPNGVWHVKNGASDGNLSFPLSDSDFTKMPLKIEGYIKDDDPIDEQLYKFHDFYKAGLIV